MGARSSFARLGPRARVASPRGLAASANHFTYPTHHAAYAGRRRQLARRHRAALSILSPWLLLPASRGPVRLRAVVTGRAVVASSHTQSLCGRKAGALRRGQAESHSRLRRGKGAERRRADGPNLRAGPARRPRGARARRAARAGGASGAGPASTNAVRRRGRVGGGLGQGSEATSGASPESGRRGQYSLVDRLFRRPVGGRPPVPVSASALVVRAGGRAPSQMTENDTMPKGFSPWGQSTC